MENCKKCEHNEHYTEGYKEEIPDPTPIAIPAGFHAPETLEDMMRRLMRTQEIQKNSMGEFETEEEANDFAVDDGENPISTLQHISMVDEFAELGKGLEPVNPPEKPAEKPAETTPEPAEKK